MSSLPARPPARLRRAAAWATLAAGLALLAARAPAAAETAPAAGLPAAVQAELEQARVEPEHAAFVVLPLDGGALQLAVHAEAPMNPASTMKLLTTYAALALLGPDYRWHTAVFASRAPKGGVLEGNLILRGDGDPSLVVERWWLLVQRLRALGLREIRGDLLLDRSRYAPGIEAGPNLDHNDLRPYNVAPDALLVNYKAITLDFVPDGAAGLARIVATPQLEGLRWPAQVRLTRAACGDWKEQLGADFSHPLAPSFRGGFPSACGPRSWHLSPPLGADEYLGASFRALWRQAGGTLRGSVRPGRVEAGSVFLAEQPSPPLSELVRDINKHSNNVMARQLFLALGDAGEDPPADRGEADEALAPPAVPAQAASPERSIGVLRGWLERQGLAMPELSLQNGSGLSRQERISAASLARLLAHAWNSADMPPFVASLPLAGIDGTMKRRKSALHSAYVKTGYLAEVRALAGYVFAASGHRYVLVALVNDPRAEAAQDAVDDFLQWVWQAG